MLLHLAPHAQRVRNGASATKRAAPNLPQLCRGAPRRRMATWKAVGTGKKTPVGSEEMTRKMLQQRLVKTESTLAFQQSLNGVLQEKLMVLIRKIDERDQRIYTMATAMRKVERETDEKAAEMDAEHKAILAGQKYTDMQDELRSRATMIVERDGKIAQMEKKMNNQAKKLKGLQSQISLAQEQRADAEKQWQKETLAVTAARSKHANAALKVRENRDALKEASMRDVFLEAQVHSRQYTPPCARALVS